MKKLLLLFVAVCATFASCDKDDDDKKFEGNADAFVGTTWEAINIYEDKDGDYKDVMTIKFVKDGKMSVNYVAYEKVNGKYEEIVGEGGRENGTYSVNGKKITLTVQDSETGEDISMEAIINGNEFSYTEKDLDGEVTVIFKLKK